MLWQNGGVSEPAAPSALLPIAGPVIDPATHACSGCHGKCCVHHTVPLGGHDLYRLARTLELPWRDLVELEEHRIALHDGFRLDRGPVHYSFVLRRRENGACVLLLELPGGHRRCGAHALRPDACRIYPLTRPPAPSDGQAATTPRVALGGHVICPAPRLAIYREALPALAPLLDEDDAERELYALILARWDLLARVVRKNQTLPAERYVDWLFALYEKLAPLRAQKKFADAARAVIGEHPLPAPPNLGDEP